MLDEADPMTWPADWSDLPVGYEWRPTVDHAATGEWHLHAPDGRDLTEAYWARLDGGE